MGAAVFLGKPLGMALPQRQQKLGKGWHRAENPEGLLLRQRQGEDRAMDPASTSPCPKKANSPPKRDTEPPRAGRARQCPLGCRSWGSGAELGAGAKGALQARGAPGLSPPRRGGHPSPNRAAGAEGKCTGC